MVGSFVLTLVIALSVYVLVKNFSILCPQINLSYTPKTNGTGLFDNVAGKIKILAQVLFWAGVAASCITAIVLWADGWEAWLGLVVIVGGPLVFCLISLPLYGFGQLIENTEKPDAKKEETPKTVETPKVTSNSLPDKLAELKKKKDNGFITEVEYDLEVERLTSK